ncbi:MAG: hypothetical protein NDI69_14860 [Bacteriovoracaceae bacterium]|nr:hypothetical protein [Bacteriovoracaceae bacterium]
MESWVKDCRYILMPARHPQPGFEKEYAMAYETWKRAWRKFREESGIAGPLFSDGFILPDEMGVLFYQSRCVGFSSFTYGNLQDGTMPDVSWFGSWDKNSYKELHSLSTNAIICSQFTVNPDFAGKDQIVRWKDIVSLYTLIRFSHSQMGVMAGSLNLTRGMQNASGEDAGAIVLNKEHRFHYGSKELPAQLVAYTKENIQAMLERKNLTGLSHDLWKQLVHISQYPVEDNIIEFKKVA